MRIVFFGTPQPAATALGVLFEAGHEVALVVTQPDRRRGRGSSLIPSPVKQVALEHNAPVRTPNRAAEVGDDCRDTEADLGVVVAFGQLLPDGLLAAFPRGCINVHYSLLPRWRGAAPVERALLAGDTETGVAIMQLDSGLDTGPIWAQAVEPISADDTAGSLLDRLSIRGARLLVDTIAQLDGLHPVPQVGEPTYAEKLTVEEFRLHWDRPADELDRIVRAGNPRPGAWTILDGARCKVLVTRVVADVSGVPGAFSERGIVATGDGGLELVRIQPEGKAAMDAAAWLVGRRGVPGRFDT